VVKKFIPINLVREQDLIYDEDPGVGESFARGLAQDVSFGFSDEIAGGMDAAAEEFKSLFSGEEVDFMQEYERGRDESRAANVKAQEQHPTAYTAGELTGMAGGMLLGTGLGKAAVKGAMKAGTKEVAKKGFLRETAEMGAKGAGFGGLSGTGFSEGEGLEETLVDTLTGVKWGAGIGSLVPSAGWAGKKAGTWAGNLSDKEASFISRKPDYIRKAKAPEEMKDDLARKLNKLNEEIREDSRKASELLSDDVGEVAYSADDIIARIEVEENKLVDTFNTSHIEPNYKSRQKYLDDMVKASEKNLEEINGEVYSAQKAVEKTKVVKLRRGKEIKGRTPGKTRAALEAAEEKRWQAGRDFDAASENSKSYKAANKALKEKQEAINNYKNANKEYIKRDLEIKELKSSVNDITNLRHDQDMARLGHSKVTDQMRDLRYAIGGTKGMERIRLQEQLSDLGKQNKRWLDKIEKNSAGIKKSMKSGEFFKDEKEMQTLISKRDRASDEMRNYADDIKDANQTVKMMEIDESEIQKITPIPITTTAQNKTALGKLTTKRKSFETWEEPISPKRLKKLIQQADEEAKWSKDPYPKTYQKSIQNLRIATDQQLLKKDFEGYARAMEPVSNKMSVMDELSETFSIKQERIGKDFDEFGNVIPLERSRGFVGTDKTIAQIKGFSEDRKNKAYRAAQKYDRLTRGSLEDETMASRVDFQTRGGQPAGSKSVVAGTALGGLGGMIAGAPGAQVGGALGAAGGLMHDKYSKLAAKKAILGKDVISKLPAVQGAKAAGRSSMELIGKVSPKFRRILQKAMDENGEKALWATHFLLSQRDPKYREESKDIMKNISKKGSFKPNY